MGEDSQKKRQELKRQISNKVQIAPDLAHVEKALAYLTSPKKWSLVEGVTRFPTNNVESRRLIISFDYFNWKACELEQFNPSKGKKLLEILEMVSKCEISKFPELKLARDSVTRVGEYESLFNTVTPEVKRIEETEFCEGRFFYIITEPYFNVISVETKHRNTDK
jgi:hypothetical protein